MPVTVPAFAVVCTWPSLLRGQPSELLLVLPRHLERPRREALHGSFADVGNFVVRAQGEQYVLWAGTPLKPDLHE